MDLLTAVVANLIGPLVAGVGVPWALQALGLTGKDERNDRQSHPDKTSRE